jgi:nitrous oxidase accessory protein
MTRTAPPSACTARTGCTVAGNRFDDTFFGVYLARVAGAPSATTSSPAAPGTESTSGNAVHLWSSRDVSVTDNRITGHRDGIYFEFVRQGRVERNLSTRNLRYGLHFMYSDSCAYRDNAFRDNGAGVAVMYTNVVTMRGNRFVDNMGGASYGLLLKEIGHATLERNEFARNTVGLMADGASHLVVRGNVFRDNGWGVRLMSNVEDGEIAGNDFAGNTFDVSTNGRRTARRSAATGSPSTAGGTSTATGAATCPTTPCASSRCSSRATSRCSCSSGACSSACSTPPSACSPRSRPRRCATTRRPCAPPAPRAR